MKENVNHRVLMLVQNSPYSQDGRVIREATALQVPLLPSGFLAALIFPGAVFLASERIANSFGEVFVRTRWSSEATVDAILTFYEEAMATLPVPGQVLRSLSGPNDLPSVTFAPQDVSFAADAVVEEGGAPDGANLVEVTVNLHPPGQ